MKPLRTLLLLVSLAFPLLLHAGDGPSQGNYPERMNWWLQARFGMFIHWDMSSIAGTEISWSRGGTKPLDITGDGAGYVEDPKYDNLYKQFNPSKFNAREWVRLAREAGMKYIVFTAKHHGGFCMWDSKLTDYDIMNTPFKRDVVKELADACHEAKMPLGLYYSQRDWHHPDYGLGDNRKYIDYMNGQLRELLTNYGKIDILWWDSYGRGDLTNFWRVGETFDLVNKLQPGILMNNRLAELGSYNLQPAPWLGDCDTPEQRLGEFQNTRPWESCMCIVEAPGGGWSYRPDGHVKSHAACMKTLLGCATGDGNLLLDVGPDATGILPKDQADALRKMGDWMKTYGESIYGTRGGPYKNGSWGGSTFKGNQIYLHISQWSGDQIQLAPLKSKVTASVCATSKGAPLKVEQTAEGITLTLPAAHQDPLDTVIRLSLSGPASAEMPDGKPLPPAGSCAGAVIRQSAADDSLSLTASSATIIGGTARTQDSGGTNNIGYWTDLGDRVEWKAHFLKPGTYRVDMNAACAADAAGGEFQLNMGSETLKAKVSSSGSWETFAASELGTIKVASAGAVTITIIPVSKPGGGLMNLAGLKFTSTDRPAFNLNPDR